MIIQTISINNHSRTTKTIHMSCPSLHLQTTVALARQTIFIFWIAQIKIRSTTSAWVQKCQTIIWSIKLNKLDRKIMKIKTIKIKMKKTYKIWFKSLKTSQIMNLIRLLQSMRKMSLKAYIVDQRQTSRMISSFLRWSIAKGVASIDRYRKAHI